jgi:hypothetical protein
VYSGNVRARDAGASGRRAGDILEAMPSRVTVEQWGDRPAWHVRVDGLRVGVVFRERREFRAVREGSSQPESGSFSSREAAAKALARVAGHRDIDARVVDLDARPARESR